MDYERSLFGMKLSDCRCLARSLAHTETLTHLDLSSNCLDDDKMRMLASGLADNITVTHLNLSHNKVGVDVTRQLGVVVAGVVCYVANMLLSDTVCHKSTCSDPAC